MNIFMLPVDEFSDVVDGFIMVDSRKTSRKVLDKYMGSENAADFLQYHSVSGDNPSGEAS